VRKGERAWVSKGARRSRGECVWGTRERAGALGDVWQAVHQRARIHSARTAQYAPYEALQLAGHAAPAVRRGAAAGAGVGAVGAAAAVREREAEAAKGRGVSQALDRRIQEARVACCAQQRREIEARARAGGAREHRRGARVRAFGGAGREPSAARPPPRSRARRAEVVEAGTDALRVAPG
jgi:hypothetical protein